MAYPLDKREKLAPPPFPPAFFQDFSCVGRWRSLLSPPSCVLLNSGSRFRESKTGSFYFDQPVYYRETSSETLTAFDLAPLALSLARDYHALVQCLWKIGKG
jgi:hypothetical protein